MATDYRFLHYKYNMSEPLPKEDVTPHQVTGRQEEDTHYYLGQLRRILETGPTYGTLPEPGILLPGFYVGTVAHAENLGLLKKLGITHVLNCAGVASVRPDREMRYYENGVEYEELPAANGETYDMTHHLRKAHLYIDQGRSRGKVLIYCPDVDRSGMIVISYLMRKGHALLNAAKLLKNCRRVGMFNRGFMRQLVKDAWDRDMLARDRPHMGAPQISSVKHLPRYALYLRV